MIYTKEYKQKIFNSFPADLKEAILSVETADKLNDICKRYNLMLDQAAELGDEVGLFMFGLTKQNDLVKNISNRLEVSVGTAENILNDINKEIFSSIRTSLQKIQSQQEQPTQSSRPAPPQPTQPFNRTLNAPPPPIRTPYQNPQQYRPPQQTIPQQQPKPVFTPKPPQPPIQPVPQPKFTPPPIIKPTIEQAGQFNIQKNQNQTTQYDPNKINRDAILKGIEDPEMPMIDHLLTTPVNTEQKTEIKKPPVENKPYTVDPYREQF